jgi:hypothetical protein
VLLLWAAFSVGCRPQLTLEISTLASVVATR